MKESNLLINDLRPVDLEQLENNDLQLQMLEPEDDEITEAFDIYSQSGGAQNSDGLEEKQTKTLNQSKLKKEKLATHFESKIQSKIERRQTMAKSRVFKGSKSMVNTNQIGNRLGYSNIIVGNRNLVRSIIDLGIENGERNLEVGHSICCKGTEGYGVCGGN